MRLFSPPEARKARVPVGAAPPQARAWVDGAARVRALGASPLRVAIEDPTGDGALELLAAGHAVTLLPGPTAAIASLKRAAVEHLPVQSVRATLGLDAAGRRIWFLHHLRPHLSEPDQAWWDAREPMVREGIFEMGAAEAAIAAARRTMQRLFPGAPALERLIGDLDAQAHLGRALSGRRGLMVAARLARSLPAPPEDGGRGLRTRMVGPLQAGRLSEAWDHQWLLAGRFADEAGAPGAGPSWLTPRGHAAVKAGLDRLTVSPGPLAPAWSALAGAGFDAAVLPPGATADRGADAARATRAGGRIITAAGAPTTAPHLDACDLLYPAPQVWTLD